MSFFALVRLSMSTTRISSRVLEVSYIARDRSATQSISPAWSWADENTSPTRKRGVGTIPRLRVGLVLKPLVQLLLAKISSNRLFFKLDEVLVQRAFLTKSQLERLSSSLKAIQEKGLGEWKMVVKENEAVKTIYNDMPTRRW